MNIDPGETMDAGKQCVNCEWCRYEVGERENFCVREVAALGTAYDFWLSCKIANPNNDCPYYEEGKP